MWIISARWTHCRGFRTEAHMSTRKRAFLIPIFGENMEQLSIFDLPDLRGERQNLRKLLKPTRKHAEEQDLSQWALVYLVTMSGGKVGNLFVLRTEDAMKLCEDECSHGSARGGRRRAGEAMPQRHRAHAERIRADVPKGGTEARIDADACLGGTGTTRMGREGEIRGRLQFSIKVVIQLEGI